MWWNQPNQSPNPGRNFFFNDSLDPVTFLGHLYDIIFAFKRNGYSLQEINEFGFDEITPFLMFLEQKMEEMGD